MPAYTKRTWQRVLDSYEIEQISKGVIVTTPYRQPATKQVYVYDRPVSGTGISSYALSKFYSGEWKPSQSTINKIISFKNRERYASLRAAGANRKEAWNAARRKDSEKVLHFYRKTVSQIAEAKGVDPAVIAASMGYSTRIEQDWDYYTKEMGYSDPDDYPEFDEEYGEYLEGESWEEV